jgi:hypothetical protein
LIGLDTHVLVRYLAQDDETQTALASRLIETVCSEEKGAEIASHEASYGAAPLLNVPGHAIPQIPGMARLVGEDHNVLRLACPVISDDEATKLP